MKPKLLFVDDNGRRIQYALDEYGKNYEVVIATNFNEAMRQLVALDFAVVSLDHDLNGGDFQDTDSPSCGMEIVRYIEKTGWPKQRKEPEFWIHSSNIFAANLMVSHLRGMGFRVLSVPLWWKKYQHGVVVGAFDVIHPGYIQMLKEAKELCHRVTVLIHDKPNQVFAVPDRVCILMALKYVDGVVSYKDEDDLSNLFAELKPDVRIVGNDHEGKTTRPNLPFATHYHVRDHDWSSTKYKRMVANCWRKHNEQ